MKKLALLIFVAVVMNYAFTIAQEDLTSPYLDSVIMEKMEIAHLAGVSACIIKNSEVSWIGNYGFANIEQGVHVDTTTLFYMASVSKTVTCTALMQLWEEGLFDLDDDINEYLPFDVHVPLYPSFPITFRMLFTHTSCIKDNAAVNPYYWGEDSPIPLGQFLFDILDPQGANYFPDLNFYNQVPGSVYNYSNVGAALAGYLVETIGDSTFSYQTKERIFNHLQMNESAWFLSEVDTSNLAMPYYWNGSELVPYGFYARSTYPAGGLRTSVDQLAKFLLSYMNGGTYLGEQILQSSTIDSIMTPQIPSLDPTQGLFWYKLYLGGRWLWGHEGSNLGAMTYMGFYPDENTGVIVFSNTADYIGYQIVDLLFDYASDSIPCSCLPEGITINTQEQIDNFQTNYPGCTEIEGDVTINGVDITNLDGLGVLTSIGGDLQIGDFYGGNPSLISLSGLDNLTSIGGFLDISGNNSLTSLSALESLTSIGEYLNIWKNIALTNLIGLDNLTYIGGNLWIGGNDALTNLTGLDNLTYIVGDFQISLNNALTSLTGLDNLTSIGGDFQISLNNALTSMEGLESLNDIYGNCRIGGNDLLSTLEGFNNLNSIGGRLEIGFYDGMVPGGNPSLVSLSGLESLTSIGGDFQIYSNSALISLSGLESLTSIGGGLGIHENNALISLSGLEGMTSIGGLSIYANYALTSLSGLESLTSTGGVLWIEGNEALISLSGLDNLTSIGGDLSIIFNYALTSLSGLESLTSIGGDLCIGGNETLTSLSGLENLISIGGNLWIIGNDALTSLSGLEGLTSIGGILRIHSNPALISLTGLENIQANSIDYLDIYWNYVLSECDVQSICDYLASPNGTISIHDNAPGCNSPEEVEEACEALTQCLPEGITFSSQEQIDSFQVNYPDCVEIEGDVKINGNDITDLNGIDVITKIGGDLTIVSNDILTGLTGLANLISIGGNLLIAGNTDLTILTGLDNIAPGTINNLSIFGNPSLSDCDVLSICEYLSAPNGTIEIHDNAPGCNSPEEVEAACEATALEEIGLNKNFFIFPNPVTEMISIIFYLGEPSFVKIEIFNLMGQQVVKFSDDLQLAGTHEFQFNAGNLKKGSYILKLTTHNHENLIKFIKVN